MLDDAAPPPVSLPNYQLGEVVGRGGFGCVYRALNWANGETIAVKQVDLSNIDQNDLPELMMEIDLLKNLNHPNIVQYLGFVKTPEYLYILLEFCENGSLQSILKKFGSFPENLVALYVLQILYGLVYLHEQGVIHRDLKAANILADKNGGVRLADFGVATRVGVGASKTEATVGSPYWMAPEVVDQTGATTASDVWSLGALVIELLTSRPPYYFLAPMTALFRIVNDDCPPLPESSSAVARDFLQQCFQKDRNLRVSAKKLLKHPWMQAAKRTADTARAARNPSPNRPLSSLAFDETVQKVQEWNKELGPVPATNAARARRPTDKRVSRRPSLDLQNALHQSAATPEVHRDAEAPVTTAASGAAPPTKKGLPIAQLISEQISSGHPLEEPIQEEGEDNWDDDFEEGISISKLASLEPEVSPTSGQHGAKEGSGETALSDFSNSDTIRPASFAAARAAVASPRAGKENGGGAEKKGMKPILEDYSDLVGEGEEDPFAGRVAILQKANKEGGKRLLHPKDLQGGPGERVNDLSARRSSLQQPQGSPQRERETYTLAQYSPPAPTRSDSGSGIAKYTEKETEDYSDVFGKSGGSPFDIEGRSLQLNTRLSNRSWLGDDDSDEEDVFAEEEGDVFDGSGDLETNVYREKLARTFAFVSEIIEVISSDTDEYTLREAALHLIDNLEEVPETKAHFVKAHGMLAVIEVLQVTRSRDILGILLRVVNLIVSSDPGTLEKICLVGGCPVVMSFAAAKYSREIRLEAALFIGSMCRTSLLTLQMFVSCRGLRVLVEMMDENYGERKDLVWMAVDGISRVLELPGLTPRNDFCRIFTNEGLLTPLSSALLSVATDEDDLAESAKHKIVHVFLLFAQSDRSVKEAMATRVIVLRLIKALGLLEPELLAPLLKTIKNLTMVPSALEVLQNANAIEVLIQILATQPDGRLGTEMSNHIVNALYNLCQLSKNRQEEAATAGAVPILQRIAHDGSPLKQFALPILCDFAHTSKTCRKILWKHGMLTFYLNLLKDPFWSTSALEAIVAWLQDETARVEDILLDPAGFEPLIRVFCKSKTATFENMLETYHKILRTSTPIASRLAVQHVFFTRIISRLSSTSASTKAVVRLNLLRLTKTVFESLVDRRDRITRVQGLVSTVQRLAEDDPAVLVREMAKELAVAFAAVKDTVDQPVRTTLAGRKLVNRRGVSEASTPSSFASLKRAGSIFGAGGGTQGGRQ